MLALKIDTTELDQKFKRMLEMPQIIEKSVVAAMSETVDRIHAAQIKEMELSFDKPTPWLKRGLIKALPGGKDKQYGQRRFGQTLAKSGTYFEEFPVGRSQNDVVRPHVFGGGRRKKASEFRLAGVAGAGGKFTAMGKDYPRNQYGNIPGAVYSRMLAAMGTIPTAQASTKGSKKSKASRYFLLRSKTGVLLVMERNGRDIIPALAFVNKTPTYQVRYDFHDIGRNQLKYSLPREFSRILNRYMSRM
jgi:hypothetical protein